MNRKDCTFNTHGLANLAFAFIAACALAACATTRLHAVPNDAQNEATVPGMPGIRYRLPDVDGLVRDARVTIQREEADLRAHGYRGSLPAIAYLAISGGAEKGAFGAGLLVGWTQHGDRPSFNVVTGVSTGALIAPFAFLGSTYDAQLKRLYTETSAADVMSFRGYLYALLGDSVADNLPLQRLVNRNITQELLEAIAGESKKGRTLLIATTDLDAQTSVLWNVTLIAESRHPNAINLVRQILIASAAIPGEFPPVMIDVEANGKHYQEMHVDGGTTHQVFTMPPQLLLNNIAPRERTLYIIRNSRLVISSKEVERNTLSIAGRAVESLIHAQGIGDIYEIAASAQRDGANLRLAYIPDDFQRVPKEPFERDFMKELFALGYDLGQKGYPWRTAPPGMEKP